MGSRRRKPSSPERIPVKGEVELVENPFGQFRKECESLVLEGLRSTGLHLPRHRVISFSSPPAQIHGDLSTAICFELSKIVSQKPEVLSLLIKDGVKGSKGDLVASVDVAGGGYLNFRVDNARLGDITLNSVQSLREHYGMIVADTPLRIVVEHTSANPAHPLHIGTARNPVLGDSIARILKARGHKVTTHFYIDDTGRQIATVAYGYRMLGKHPPTREVKPDHYIGQIYAITSCLTKLHTVRRQIDELAVQSTSVEVKEKLENELKEWESVAGDLHQKYPQLFEELKEKILLEPNPNLRIEGLMSKYEAMDDEAKTLFREVTGKCLEGFQATLRSLGILFDAWDWESELVWDNSVSGVLNQLEQSDFTQKKDGALEFDAQRAVEEMGLSKILGIGAEETIPPLTLTRSDGTSLYTTKDIAYSIKKFGQAEKVINVIGAEQTVSQLQLRAALCVMGLRWMAENQVHFPVGLVDLPGYRMSGRRGRYITLDDVLAESQRRALNEVSVRNPSLPEEDKIRIAREVGLGAVKFALLSVESKKAVTFVWGRALDFEQNSAPFIQYAHVRACNILEKSEETIRSNAGALLTESSEKSLILKLSRFPEVFVEAAETLRPRLISEYANNLAKEFNSFYASVPVLRSSPRELRSTRLCLVDSVRIVLANSLNLLGIDAPSRM